MPSPLPASSGWLASLIQWCLCACAFLFIVVSHTLGALLRPCLALASSGSWRRSLPPWRHLRTRTLTASSLCWFRLLASLCQTTSSLLRSRALPPAHARSAFASPASAPARRPLLPCSRSQRMPPTLSASPHCPRLAARLPVCPRPPPNRLVRTPLTPLRRRRMRKQAKRSTWREIWPEAHGRFAMWRCCDDASSDDDVHNTSNPQSAHGLVAPALPSGLTELDELSFALASRLALDVFTSIHQDCPPADQESVQSLDLLSLDAPRELVAPGAGTGGRAQATARSVPAVPPHGRPSSTVSTM